MFNTIAYAQAAEGAATTGIMDMLRQNSMLPMMVVIFAIFYFMVMRPQKKKQQEMAEQLRQLKTGDKVVLNSGIYGTIEGVQDNTYFVNIASGLTIQVATNAVAGRVAPKGSESK